jgi:hypothetical protein
MYNFIKRIILFLLPIIIVLCFAEYVLRIIPNNYTNKAINISLYGDSIETLYLGNSHILFGINPDLTKSWDFNLASTSQSIDLDLMLLEKFKNKLPNLKCVIVSLDYFTLRTTLSQGIENWRIKNYVIYYYLYNWFNPRYYFEVLNGLPTENLLRIARFLKNNKSDVNSNHLGWGTNYNITREPNLTISGYEAAKRHTFASSNIIQTNTQTLDSFVNYAQKFNLKILFISSPVSSYYTKHLDTIQLQEVINKGQSLQKLHHKHIKYINLIKSPLFTDEDFYDGDHLNQKGTRKLTNITDSLVKSITIYK